MFTARRQHCRLAHVARSLRQSSAGPSSDCSAGKSRHTTAITHKITGRRHHSFCLSERSGGGSGGGGGGAVCYRGSPIGRDDPTGPRGDCGSGSMIQAAPVHFWVGRQVLCGCFSTVWRPAASSRGVAWGVGGGLGASRHRAAVQVHLDTRVLLLKPVNYLYIFIQKLVLSFYFDGGL